MMAKQKPVVSVFHRPGLRYPSSASAFSPDSRFPEYPWKHISPEPNPIYSGVRQCLIDAGLDVENVGKPEWNPLGCYIRPGQKVFVLCNFVKHNITRRPEVMDAKCTHGSVVRAIIDYVLIALQGKGQVSFGNAPLQSCDWAKVTEETGAATVQAFYSQLPDPKPMVRLCDLRQLVIERHAIGTVDVRFRGQEEEFCVPVDLGADSLLDGFYKSSGNPEFRVLDYDYRRTKRCHSTGQHLYLMSKHIIQSDVVISLPKLKTHEKVGITCGIKGCVGAVGQKDCLAHHRLGPPRKGGDEYPDWCSFLSPLSKLHDSVYSREPGRVRALLHILDCHLRRVARKFARCFGGAWPGNDTCWRMALDLARIVEYADQRGKLQPARQRTHLLFTDGIVAGEGNGPLSPVPVPLGYLSFADNLAWGDYVDCLAMGYDPEMIPMVREAFRTDKFSLVANVASDPTLRLNGALVDFGHLRQEFGKKFLPPREWRRYL